MKIVVQRFGAGLASILVSLGLVIYGIQPVIARADSTPPVTSSDTQPTNTTSSTPQGTTNTTSSTPTDTTTTSSPTTTDTTTPATTPTSDNSTTTAPAASTTSTQPQSNTGPQKPTGDASNTYVYNAATGMWENDHYIWNPATGQTSPKDPVSYSYNPTTKMWDTTQWVYNAAAGKYEPNVISVSTPPGGANTSNDKGGQPLAVSALNAPSNSNLPVTGSSVLNGNHGSGTTGIFDLYYNATISNNIDSQATSGNATVGNNTIGGDATSGNASAIANVLNMINSSWGLASANPLMFVANVVGNVIGDLFINPSNLFNKSPTNTTVTDANKVTVNSTTNNAINNNINLGANSGDALVQLNTKAGDATSGNATTMANVMNLMNTSIGTGQSFLGMINIYGNLNGDILLPPGVLDSLLANNSQPDAALNNSSQNTTSLNANLNNTTNINNQINATAKSGTATVGNNTIAGNATTGNASTNVTLLNFTGRQVVGKDALLVFVNVMGKWVGMIFNAPTGSTSGAFGGGITQNSSLNSANTANFNVNSNNTINNNINVNATSGNATVANNTIGGNATSGNASTGVNVLNIANSQFNLSDWFGVLFINVFGNWYGSFGVNTDAGNPIKTPSVADTASTNVFKFLPKTKTSVGGTTAITGTNVVADPASPADNNGAKVLGATSIGRPNSPISTVVGKSGFGIIQYTMFALLAVSLISTLIYWWKTRESQYLKPLS